MEAIPTGRNIQALGILIPGTGLQGGGSSAMSVDVGGTGILAQSPLSYHGSNDSVMAIDGMRANNLCGSGQYVATLLSDSVFEQISYATGADSAEMGQSGLRINMIPKEGGNAFKGSIAFSGATSAMQAMNLDAELRDRGLLNVGEVQRIWDFTPSIGGPIAKDRLWFYWTLFHRGLSKTVPDFFFDKNPLDDVDQPDVQRPAPDEGRNGGTALRLTWQAAAKHKISGYYDRADRYRGHKGAIGNWAPEATNYYYLPLVYTGQLKWSAPITNTLFIEGGFTEFYQRTSELYQPNTYPYAIDDVGTGRRYGTWFGGYRWELSDVQTYRGAVSFVTGSHALQTGVVLTRGVAGVRTYYNNDLTLTYRNGQPQSVTLRLPTEPWTGINADLGAWIQEKWTVNRVTLNLGLRFDWFDGFVDEATLPASRWAPSQSFSAIRGVPNWSDLSPRLGVVYDLFGNGKTAVRVNTSRYVAAQTVNYANSVNPMTTIGLTNVRTWTDPNGDRIPQPEEFGPSTNNNFGKGIPSTTVTDPAVGEGWFSRGYSWEFSGGISHELRSGVAANASYHRRIQGNLLRTDNQGVAPSDYSEFSILAPSDPRLPGGGGFAISGLYDISPAKRGVQQNYRTFTDDLGGKRSNVYTSYDLTLSARLPRGTTLQGGPSIGRLVDEDCAAIDNPSTRFCKVTQPFRAQWKLLGSYALGAGFQASGTFQFVPGPTITARYSASNSEIIGLGRDLAAGRNATVAVELIEPQTMFERAMKQLDLRLTRRFRIAGSRSLQMSADLYNVTNDNAVIRLNTTYGPQWLRPIQILEGRLFRIGGQLNF
jgi:hypothetical protein